jgi:uncharacterized membrane protein
MLFSKSLHGYRITLMPYQWTQDSSTLTQKLRLWPHNSLPKQGMAAFVLGTFTMICIPALALLGSPVLWGLLPFLLAAVWGIYFAFQRNYHAREIVETLTIGPKTARLERKDPSGNVQEWDCNRHWTKITKYDNEGPVPNYITLRGMGREVEIGAFLSEEERVALYDDLVRVWHRADTDWQPL